MDGVVKLLPLPSEEPPDAAENHSMVPEDGVALMLTVPLPQREPSVEEETVGRPFTTACTAALAEMQPLAATASA